MRPLPPGERGWRSALGGCDDGARVLAAAAGSARGPDRLELEGSVPAEELRPWLGQGARAGGKDAMHDRHNMRGKQDPGGRPHHFRSGIPGRSFWIRDGRGVAGGERAHCRVRDADGWGRLVEINGTSQYLVFRRLDRRASQINELAGWVWRGND